MPQSSYRHHLNELRVRKLLGHLIFQYRGRLRLGSWSNAWQHPDFLPLSQKHVDEYVHRALWLFVLLPLSFQVNLCRLNAALNKLEYTVHLFWRVHLSIGARVQCAGAIAAHLNLGNQRRLGRRYGASQPAPHRDELRQDLNTYPSLSLFQITKLQGRRVQYRVRMLLHP